MLEAKTSHQLQQLEVLLKLNKLFKKNTQVVIQANAHKKRK